METGLEVGQRISDRRERLGVSWTRLARLVQERIGLYAPTAETLRTWAKGGVDPEKIDPYVVAALADIFTCTVADISTTAASNLRRLQQLMGRVDIDLTETSDQPRRGSWWSPATVDQPTLFDEANDLPSWDTVIDLRVDRTIANPIQGEAIQLAGVA